MGRPWLVEEESLYSRNMITYMGPYCRNKITYMGPFLTGPFVLDRD